ncbi:MAG: 6-phosphogluconolactonase [Planctomycetota bacterium]|jgi:6-phosphogluconolactonase
MKTIADYKPNVEVVSDAETLARRTIELFVTDAQKALASNGRFYVAISGGNTPRRFFELLGDLPQVKALPWQNIQLFWVDERYVSPDSKWSNYKLAADTFIPKLPIPPDNIHRIPTENTDSNAAARDYEQTIRGVFGLQQNQLPRFDLILLGMGPDGHTGSLFPNSYASFDKDDLACVVYVLDQKLNRITLTHPVLCAASHLAVLVTGEEKAPILKQVLTSPPDEIRYPIHILWPCLAKVSWLVDSHAAKLL